MELYRLVSDCMVLYRTESDCTAPPQLGTLEPSRALISAVSHLFELVQLVSEGFVFGLQLLMALLELLLLLKHRQPVLRRADLIPARLAQLPGQALELGPETLHAGLRDQHCPGITLLLHPGNVSP